MSLRKFISMAAVGVALFLVMGCAPSAQPAPSPQTPSDQSKPQEPKRGGTLNLVQTLGDPPSFDTQQESTGATTQAVHPSYDNLIRFDFNEPDKIVPDLAEKWTVSPDGKKYTFSLVKGVKFHKGQPFTSADVKFTIDRVMNPPKGMVSPRRDQFKAVTSVETPDANTVVINTSRPNPSLLAALSQGVLPIYSKTWIEASDPLIPQKEVNGTGPFIFKEWIRGTSVESVKNPDYWLNDLPYLDKIKQYLITDPNTSLAAFRTGQVDLFSIPAANRKQLTQEMAEKVNFTASEGEGFSAMIPNHKRKPWDDAKVRQALNLTVDRNVAIQVLQGGDGVPGAYLKTSGFWGLSPEELAKLPGYGKDKAKDIEDAKKLLTEAGLKPPMDVILLTRKLQSYIDTATVYADQIKKIGLNATIKPYETAEAYDIIRNGDYDLIAWGFGYSLEDPDAIYGEFVLCGAVRNWGNACTPEVDKLFEQQSQELDQNKRQQIVREMEKKALLANQMIVSHRSVGTTGLYKFVKGYTPHAATRNNQRFSYAWLDK